MNWIHVVETVIGVLIAFAFTALALEAYTLIYMRRDRSEGPVLDLRSNPLDTEEHANVPAKRFVPTTGFLECKACGKSKDQVDEEITKLKFCYPTGFGAGRVDFHDWAWVEDVVTTPTRTVEPLNDFERALNG